MFRQLQQSLFIVSANDTFSVASKDFNLLSSAFTILMKLNCSNNVVKKNSETLGSVRELQQSDDNR